MEALKNYHLRNTQGGEQQNKGPGMLGIKVGLVMKLTRWGGVSGS